MPATGTHDSPFIKYIKLRSPRKNLRNRVYQIFLDTCFGHTFGQHLSKILSKPLSRFFFSDTTPCFYMAQKVHFVQKCPTQTIQIFLECAIFRTNLYLERETPQNTNLSQILFYRLLGRASFYLSAP